MFLKYQRFSYFPIIKKSNLCNLLAFIYKAIDKHSLFFLCPERCLVANVQLGSSL